MKVIDTLIEDIHSLLNEGVLEVSDKDIETFGEAMGKSVSRQLLVEERGKTGLRMSNIGSPCQRKLWYTVNDPDNHLREPLEGYTRVKFMYGDLTEELILLLAHLSGHKVEGLQDEVSINGIKGHIDAIIDGMLVDVKSAATFSFRKFKGHTLDKDDSFGYIPQLMSYLYSLQDDDRLLYKDRAAFLAFDKQLGHMCLDVWDKPDWFDQIPEAYERRSEMVASDTPPDRDFHPVPEGKQGNMALGTFCSYCDFKKVCYPTMQTYLYARGPKFLTKVVKEPDVPKA